MDIFVYISVFIILCFILYLIIKYAVINGIIEANEIIRIDNRRRAKHNNNNNNNNNNDTDNDNEVVIDESDGERSRVKADCPECGIKHDAGLPRCPLCDYEYDQSDKD